MPSNVGGRIQTSTHTHTHTHSLMTPRCVSGDESVQRQRSRPSPEESPPPSRDPPQRRITVGLVSNERWHALQCRRFIKSRARAAGKRVPGGTGWEPEKPLSQWIVHLGIHKGTHFNHNAPPHFPPPAPLPCSPSPLSVSSQARSPDSVFQLQMSLS